MNSLENLKKKLKQKIVKVKDGGFDEVVKELGFVQSDEECNVYEKRLDFESDVYVFIDKRSNIANLYLSGEWYNNVIGAERLAQLFEILTSGYFEIVPAPLDSRLIEQYNSTLKEAKELKKLFESREVK